MYKKLNKGALQGPLGDIGGHETSCETTLVVHVDKDIPKKDLVI